MKISWKCEHYHKDPPRDRLSEIPTKFDSRNIMRQPRYEIKVGFHTEKECVKAVKYFEYFLSMNMFSHLRFSPSLFYNRGRIWRRERIWKWRSEFRILFELFIFKYHPAAHREDLWLHCWYTLKAHINQMCTKNHFLQIFVSVCICLQSHVSHFVFTNQIFSNNCRFVNVYILLYCLGRLVDLHLNCNAGK